MEFHVVGMIDRDSFPCVHDFCIRHPDDFGDISLNSWYFIFMRMLKVASDGFSCFSVFNDDGILCAFMNEDRVLWFNDDYVLGSEQDGLEYGNFYMLCIDFDRFRVEEV